MFSLYHKRLSQLRARMQETQTDLLVIGPSSHMVWLTGLSPHGDERPVMLMVSQSHAGFLMPALNVSSCRKKTNIEFYSWSDGEGPNAALSRLLADIGSQKTDISVVIDETMRADFALLVLDRIMVKNRNYTIDTIGYLRSIKDDYEYEILKQNAIINDGAMQAAFAALKVGITEVEIATIVKQYYKDHGARTEFTSVCFGENGAFPHHHTGDQKLKQNDCVLIDIGGRYKGYPSDMTRVTVFGEPSEKFKQVHQIVEKAVAAALNAAKPGVRASDVDSAARKVIVDSGYGDCFLHRTGHGLGIDLHELPNIAANSDVVLQAGHVFSIEPGIYLQGEFGIRLEEIVILREDGPEILSNLKREIFPTK